MSKLGSGGKGSAPGGSGKKPAVQSNSMLSYFGKKDSTTGTVAPPKPMPAPAAAAAAAPASAAAAPPAASAAPSAAAPVSPVRELTPELKAQIEKRRLEAEAKKRAAEVAKAATPAAAAASYFGMSAAPAAPAAPKPVFNTPPKAAAPASAAPSPATDLSASGRKRKLISYAEGDDDDDATPAKPASASKKRGGRKDDDDDFAASSSGGDDEDEEASFAESDDGEERKVPAKKARTAPASSASKKAAPAKKKAAAMDEGEEEEGSGGKGDYSTPFLTDRRDKNKRRPGDPGYDSTSLYISPEQYAKMTPGERQYWEHKSVNMDLVLFFKVGKFYEMFDLDAEVGVKELGLSYMLNQKRPHAGFPEMALSKYAERLVNLGYKVGQVDQTETPEQLKEANKNLKKGEKKRQTVRRELSDVLTPGTIVESDVLGSADANYLFALCERELTAEEIAAEEQEQLEVQQRIAQAAQEGAARSALEEEANIFVVELGFCYVDCTTGKFVVGQRRDDKQRSFLKTLLGQVSPREVVLPRGGLSDVTQQVLRFELPLNVIKNEVAQGSEFWSAERTVQEIEKRRYFEARRLHMSVDEAAGAAVPTGPYAHWPKALQLLQSGSQKLALSALGGTIFYLRRSLHDGELVSLSNFARWQDLADYKEAMALDGQTLANLEIVKNQDGTLKGTLLEFVDRTVTPFGKRKLRTWIMSPLFNIAAITERQNAVAFWMEHPDKADSIRSLAKKLPDLERLLSRVHAHGQKRTMQVIMYEDVSLKKLELFLKVLTGFDAISHMLRRMDTIRDEFGEEVPTRIRELTTLVTEQGLLPNFTAALDEIKAKFDYKLAMDKKKIVAFAGLDPEYDDACRELQQIEDECAAYLSKIKKQLGDSNIKWVHKNKERFQIEVPVKIADRVSKDWDLVSSNKTSKRFWSRTSRELSARIAEAETRKEEMEKDTARAVFAAFSEHYTAFARTVECIGELDCLLSLALVSAHHAGCVRPEFLSPAQSGGRALLDLRQAVHPTLYESQNVNGLRPGSDNTFIANDVCLGVPEENPARFVLVTGPNMGGKSTLLRQTCCAVILAQVGCWIPAESCRLTPVDRIFTRVGASDRIMQGQSTFLVELAETSVILKNATARSLVILDELGRGTSTFDGTAIAHAVIQYLAHSVDCLALFSTHYHMLIDEFKDDPLIAMYHMACRVEPGASDVTFLYKFIKGVAIKSYGSNVAMAAGLPQSIVRRAEQMSERFEQRCVEAMGHNRAQLSVAFPQQKPNVTPATLSLPRSTVDALADAVAKKDWAAVLQLKQAFELAQAHYVKAEQREQAQSSMQTA